MKIALLIPTCDAYLRVARVTISALDIFWPGHPDVRIYGTSSNCHAGYIKTESNGRDWIGLAIEATATLLGEGYTHAYLILDDHPPFLRCNAEYLNSRLPVQAEALGAVYVGLNGWDQYSEKMGDVLGADLMHWMRNDAGFKWKYSLHPAFWDLKGLYSILVGIRSNCPHLSTARDFEAGARSAGIWLGERFNKGSFRVKGDGYELHAKWFQMKCSRALLRGMLNVSRVSARLLGSDLVDGIDSKMRIWTNFYNGPYPHYWSGLMHGGGVFRDAARFIRWSNEKMMIALLDSLGKS